MSGRIVDLIGNAEDAVFACIDDAELGLTEVLCRCEHAGQSISRHNDLYTVTNSNGDVVHKFIIRSYLDE